MHAPTLRETVITADKPWEGTTVSGVSVIRDGPLYRLYYSTGAEVAKDVRMFAVAESSDGVRWSKPRVGAVALNGSRENNLVWPVDKGPRSHLVPFVDRNPAAPPGERYKALGVSGQYDVYAAVSGDGLQWRPLQADPVISYVGNDPMIDSTTVAFWDPREQQYVAYVRGWINFRLRSVRRLTSRDFRHWENERYLDFGDSEAEHLYWATPVLYERAPGMILMLTKRFVPWRKFFPDWPYAGLSEIVLLSSRDGLRFDRTFLDPYIPPGPDPKNWHERAISPVAGLFEISPEEMAFYYNENVRTATARIRRAVVRTDGFVSVHAPWSGGEFVTKPFVVEGEALEINYSTSVAGSIRVEILDANGQPVPGFRLDECAEIFGDEMSGAVEWRRGHHEVLTPDRREIPNLASDLSYPLRGKVVQLRFVMKSADLFSFRIR